MACQLLLDTPLTPEQREYAQTARRSGEALLTLVNELLDFSKIEAGRLELEAIERMGGTDEVEVARALAAEPALAGVPLVTLSFSGQPASPPGEGITTQLAKPMRPMRLLEALSEVLGDARARTATASAPPEAASAAVAAPRLSILVAEDNAVNQKVITRMLEKLGHRVDVAADGRQAVDTLGRTVYDLVFMDCQMPEMDGFEATRAIRATEAGTLRHLPIVALTANARPEDRDRCLAAGMDDHLAKPISKHTLTQAIDRWTARA